MLKGFENWFLMKLAKLQKILAFKALLLSRKGSGDDKQLKPSDSDSESQSKVKGRVEDVSVKST